MITVYETRFLAFITKIVLLTSAVLILFMPDFGAEEPRYEMPSDLIALMRSD
jgi:hypothetical protein